MKDPKDAARDLRNIYEMPFKMQLHANGQSDYACSFGLLRQIKEIKEGLAAGGSSDFGIQERLREKEQQVRELSAKVDQRDQEIRDLWSKIWTLVAPKN